ncbi:MAG TPA: LamG-like jellyroll fold domain-containing protein, partial [Verrucomicrobiae bacterium]
MKTMPQYLCSLLLLSFSSLVHAQSISTWTGAANNLWNDPANWTPHGVPGADAVAVINSGSPDATALGEFNIYGVTLSGGTLTANGLTALQLNLNNGTLAGTNRVAAGGNWNWKAGWVSGRLILEGGATATLSTTGVKWLADTAELLNCGELTWTGGELRGNTHYGGATIRNGAGSRFVVNGGAGLTRYYASVDGRFIVEAGAVLVKGGSGDITGNWRLENAGVVAVEQGTLRWNAGGTSGGVFTNQAGGWLVFSGGTHTLADGTRLTGEGGYQVTAGTVTANGVVTHGRADSPGVLQLAGGTLDGNGLIAAGRFTWSSGWIGGRFTLTNGATAELSSGSDKWLADNAELHNYGTVTWTGGLLRGNTRYGPATVMNHSNAVFHLAADGTPFARYYGSQPFHFVNAPGALLRKSSAGTVSINNLWLNQQGELRVEAGSMDLNSPVTLADGGRFTGAGLVRQTGDTITLAGLLTLEGASFQMLGGTLNSSAAGRIATLNNGLWEWSGGSLSGTLTLTNGANARLSGGSDKWFADNAALHNYGSVTWTGGALKGNCHYGPATIHNRASGLFTIAGSTLLNRYYTSYNAAFTNDGTLALGTPGGLVGGDWRFTQGDSGVVELLLAGTSPGTQFGRWTTTGSGTLGGALRVGFAGEYRPLTGSAFPFLSASPLAGDFASTELPPLSPGLSWEVTRTNNAMTLRVLGEPECLPPPAGLISWWNAEGNANDVLGVNHGTIEGAVTYEPGRVGQAFRFHGWPDSVIVPDSSSLDLSNQFTIEAWVNLAVNSNDPHGPGRGIVSKIGGAGGNNGYQFVLGLSPDSSGLAGTFNSPGQSWQDGYWIGYTFTPALPTNVWMHVAFTYDQNAEVLYFNGLPVVTNVIGPRAMVNSASRLRISGDDNGNVCFDGWIDDVRIYNRALSAAEIAQLHTAGGGLCLATDLKIAMTAAPQPGVVGSNLVFTLTVTNAGPGEASNVTVTDPLPASMAFVSAVASQGSATHSGQGVTAKLGILTNGGWATVTITVTPTAFGPLTNTASVAAGEVDPNPANNSAMMTLMVEPPEQRVLLVFLHAYAYVDAEAYKCYHALTNAGAMAEFVDLTVNGQVAARLATNSYEQVWVLDWSWSPDDYPADWQAIADWFTNRSARALVCDARSHASYRNDRWQSEGLRLTENYYENLKRAGGGLVLATDFSFFLFGMSSLNDHLGLRPFRDEFIEPSIQVDPGSPLMTYPNNLGTSLPADYGMGQAPFGLQPNGLILYGAGWYGGNTNLPGITSTFQGSTGFRVEIAQPADGSQFNEEVAIQLRAQPIGGLAPFSFQWSSDRDGALGTNREFTVATLSPGTHVLSVLAGDSLGQADSASVQITVLFVPPAVTLGLQAGSDTGQSNGDRITMNTTPTVDCTVNKRGSVEVDFTGDAAPEQVLTNLAAGSYTATSPALADGVRVITARFVPLRGDPVTNTLAVTIDTQGPRVVALTPAADSTVNQLLSQVELTFDSAMHADTFTPVDASLVGPAGPVASSGVSALAGNRFRVTFPAQRVNGDYALTVGPQIADVAGNWMDQNADGTNGTPTLDVFSATWTLSLPDLLAVDVSAPPTAIAGQPISIVSTLRNLGTAPALAPWTQKLELWNTPTSGVAQVLAQWSWTNSLPVAAALTATNAVIIPTGMAGQYWLALTTDSAQQVAEAEEGNNVLVATQAVQILAPDLEVSHLAAPSTAHFGEAFPVVWAVRNAGT